MNVFYKIALSTTLVITLCTSALSDDKNSFTKEQINQRCNEILEAQASNIDSAYLLVYSLDEQIKGGNYTPKIFFRVKFILGHTNWLKKHYRLAAEAFIDAISYADTSINVRNVGVAYNMIGSCFDEANKQDKAIEYYVKGLEIGQMSGASDVEFQSLGGLYSVYYENKMYDAALKYANTAIDRCKVERDTLDMALMIGGKGMVYLDLNQPKTALSIFLGADTLLSKTKLIKPSNLNSIEGNNYKYHLEVQADVYSKIASTYSILGQYDLADLYYAKCRNSFDNISGMILDYVANKAAIKMNINRKRYDIALSQLNELEKLIGEENRYSNDYANIMGQYAEVYNALNQNDKAYYYLKQNKEIEDSLSSEGLKQKLSELEVMYELEHKNALIAKQETTMHKQTNIIYIMLAAFALVCATAIFIIFRRKNNQLEDEIINQIEQVNYSKTKIIDLQTILTANSIPINNREDQDAVLIAKIDNLMESSKCYLNADISRRKIALELGTNELYVSNAIKSKHKQTFNEYINALRLDHSLYLLEHEGQLLVDTIAEMSGFSSSRTFYRLFKTRYGVTPLTYKQRYNR